MPSIKAELSVKLDVSSLATTFLAGVQTPFGDLQAIADPLAAGDLADLQARTGGLDLSSIEAAVASVAAAAGELAGSLPVASDVLQPLTRWLELVASVLANPELGDFEVRVEALVGQLSALLDGEGESGFLAQLHAVALALGEAREGRLLLDLVAKLTAGGGVSLPQVPIAEGIQALDGAVRVFGGLMVLDAVTADMERLSGVMAARLDPGSFEAHLASLEASLDVDGVRLPAALLAVDPLDTAAVAALDLRVGAVAATLDHVRDELAAALGFGEATLAYLDVDRILTELDGARHLVRTGDLAPLERICQRLAGGLAPFLDERLLDGPRQTLDALVGRAEARVGEIASQIEAVNVARFVTPLEDGIGVLLAPLAAVEEVLGEVRVAYEGALGGVRKGVEALPLPAIADAIRALLEPIQEILAAIEQLVDAIRAALETAASSTTSALTAVEVQIDDLAGELEALFGEAKKALDALGIEASLGAVEDNVRQLSTALGKARMAPYFDAAASAIETAAAAIEAVPFELLPESMKAEVDEAVRPIREANAGAVQVEIEGTLDFTPEGEFAVLSQLDAVIAELQASYDALIAEIRQRDPRTALSAVDEEIAKIAERIEGLAPALTLEPVRQAIDQVGQAIQGIDLETPLDPVRAAFDQVTGAVEGFRPTTLIGGVESELGELRQRLLEVTRLDQWEEALAGLAQRADDLAALYNPARLGHQLELGLGEAVALLDRFPAARASDGLGAVVAGLLSGMGLRVYPHSFQVVSDWLGGGSGTAVLEARAASIAAAMVRTHDAVGQLDFAGRAGAVAVEIDRLRDAIPTLTAALPADAPVRVSLTAAVPRLDATATFGGLDGNRTRYLAALAAARDRSEAVRQAGFSEVDVRVADLGRAIAPLDPARTWMRRVLEQAGLGGFELGLGGVVGALLTVVPPARLVAIVMPIFDALENRVQALVAALLAPLQNGIASLRSALDAIDLAPLLAALDSVHAAVLGQIEALHPDALLGPSLAAVDSLRDSLVGADPLTPVLAILDALRDTIARVLAKLSLDHLLATPLAVYDQILAILGRLDIAVLIAPLRAELGEIALEVHAGLDRTVTAFERLQESLPSGGGGSSASVSASVSVGL